MSLSVKVYAKFPIFIQNALVSLKGLLQHSSRYGKEYKEYLNYLYKFDQLNLERKSEIQNTELNAFITEVRQKSRFYQRLYSHLPEFSELKISDLQKLPWVDKEMLRNNMTDLVTITSRGNVEGHTGGTTGKSLVILRTKRDMQRRMAMLDHFKRRVGFEHLKMRRATFNGKHIVPPNQTEKVFWRYNMACKQMIYSSFHLSEANMRFYVASLNKFKPHSLDGFFTCMVDLASYIERNNIALTFTPVAIFPTSETLTLEGRRLLERVFKCKVYDQYASSEGAPFVTECKHQRLHVEMHSGVFEYFDESEEVLVTSFTSIGTPLVRYRIGDSMKFLPSNTRCECGNESLMVEYIVGRKLDFIYTSDGSKINAGNLSNIFKNVPNAIVRSQLLQSKIGEVEILIEADKVRYKPEYDDVIRNEFYSKFDKSTKLTIRHVSQIPRESSGKFRFIKNSVVL